MAIYLERLANEFQSDYLRKGFAQEKIKLEDLEIDLKKGLAKAKLIVLNPYISNYKDAQNLIHLSDLTAYVALGQLIIGFNCFQYGISKEKLGELWQRSYFTQNKKSIAIDGGRISLEIKREKQVETNKLIYQTWNFDISHGSFFGEIKCALENLLEK